MTNHANSRLLTGSSISRHDDFIVPSLPTVTRCNRFDDFVRRIDKLIPGVSHRMALMLCMICFEQMRSLDDLISILDGLKDALIGVNGIYVDWTSEGRVERRKLADRSIVALARVNIREGDWRADLDELKSFLAKNYPGADRCLSKEIFESVFQDSTAWSYFVLPRFCFALSEGMLPHGQLPRERLKAVIFQESGERNWTDRADPFGAEALVLGWNASYQKLYESGVFISTSCYCLETLKGVFAFCGQDGQMRVSDWRERTQIMGKVNSVAQHVLAEGTQVDALLLGWICHLLSVGSVKLNNPAAGTIANYFSVIAPKVSQAFAAADAAPGDLSKEGWDDVFKHVIANLPATAHAAFLSFSFFCIECFAIDWDTSPLKGIPQQVTPRAAHITANEFHRCLNFSAHVTRDKRACAAIQAIFALGWGCAPRIGEVWGLHIQDIFVYDSKVEVHFMPPGAEHQGKSRAAKRTMVIMDPVAVQILKHWLQHRVEEGALATDFLFGDPHQSRQRYLMGECTRLVNQLMKQVCGDVLASFHDFRHAWVNRQVLQAVNEADEALRFEELRVQLGHAPLSDTFLTSYFCMLEEVRRTATDKYLCAVCIDSTTASFWLEKTATALRAAKRRSTQPSEYFWNALANHSREICAKRITHSLTEHPSSSPSRDTRLSLIVVRKFLADVQSSFQFDAIGFRCSLDNESIAALCAGVNQAYGLLTDTFVHSFPALKVDQNNIEDCRKRLESIEFDFALNVEPAFVEVSRCLTKFSVASHELSRAIQGWGTAVLGAHLSLIRPAEVVPLLRQLKELGMDDSVYQIRYACNDPNDLHSRATALSSTIVQSAVVSLGSVIRFATQPLPVRAHKGVPSVYLVIQRTSKLQGKHPFAAASCRSKKLNGFLFSILVWSFLSNGSVA